MSSSRRSGAEPRGAARKVVLVTGASSGLGNACATVLAKRGFQVYGTCRKPAAVTRRADEFFELIAMDLGDDYSVTTAVSYIVEREGGIDAVVHAACPGIAGPVEEIPIDAAARQIDEGLTGTARVVRAALPSVRARRGTILVVGSLAGRLALPFQAHYTAVKFALAGFVQSLRLELTGLGVRVALIEPGDFRTGFLAARTKLGDASGPYSDNAKRALEIAEAGERQGADPILFARLALKLLGKKRVTARYSVGSRGQRAAAMLSRLLPPCLVELGLRIHFDLRKPASRSGSAIKPATPPGAKERAVASGGRKLAETERS